MVKVARIFAGAGSALAHADEKKRPAFAGRCELRFLVR
jgi:hypothetical protein